MYVEKVTMKDFRCFEQAEASFVYPGKEGLPEGALDNVTLLIGINGTGKTSVLRATTLSGLTQIVTQMGFWPVNLVRRANDDDRKPHFLNLTGEFWLQEQDINDDDELGEEIVGEVESNDLEIVLDGDSEFFSSWGAGRTFQHPTTPMYDGSSPVCFLIGYGAFRRTEYAESLDSQRAKRRHPRFQRVAGLFEDYITLYPLAAWYPTLESKPRQKEVRELLNGLLPEGTEFTGEFKDADALFQHNGVKLPFGALSDGFRSYIGLVADMLYHLNYVCPKKAKLTDLSGVVMIDDIDVHLHPKWQREVVPKLATTFPKLQFIITSHSPLVAGTLHAANIRVIEDNQIHEYTERIHGLSADQILTSSYFGLDSPRAPAAEKKLNTVAKRVADTHDPAAAIEFLKELTGGTNGPPAKKKPKTGKKK